MSILFSAYKQYIRFVLLMMLFASGLFTIFSSINLFAYSKVKTGLLESADFSNNEIKIKLIDDDKSYHAAPNNYSVLEICDTSLFRKNSKAEISFINQSLIQNVVIDNKYAIKKGALYKDHFYTMIGIPIVWILVFILYRQFIKHN